MRSCACSVAPSTTFSRAPDANNAVGRPASRERQSRRPAQIRFGSVEVVRWYSATRPNVIR
jgi:hypothetical protein